MVAVPPEKNVRGEGSVRTLRLGRAVTVSGNRDRRKGCCRGRKARRLQIWRIAR